MKWPLCVRNTTHADRVAADLVTTRCDNTRFSSTSSTAMCAMAKDVLPGDVNHANTRSITAKDVCSLEQDGPTRDLSRRRTCSLKKDTPSTKYLTATIRPPRRSNAQTLTSGRLSALQAAPRYPLLSGTPSTAGERRRVRQVHLVQPDAVAVLAGRLPREEPLGVGRHPQRLYDPVRGHAGLPRVHGPARVRRPARLRRHRRQRAPPERLRADAVAEHHRRRRWRGGRRARRSA